MASVDVAEYLAPLSFPRVLLAWRGESATRGVVLETDQPHQGDQLITKLQKYGQEARLVRLRGSERA